MEDFVAEDTIAKLE